MFQGTTPLPVLAMGAEQVRDWDAPLVAVGCSGNFSWERAITGVTRAPIWSNDVSLYSTAIGAFLARSASTIALRPDLPDALAPLRETGETPLDLAATMILALPLAQSLRRDTLYDRRMVRAMLDAWPARHAAMTERLRPLAGLISDYRAEDVLTWLERLPDDAGVLICPPFYRGGYERLFGPLEDLFVWPDRPDYARIDDGSAELLERVTARKHWLIAVHAEQTGWDDALRGLSTRTNRGATYRVYASGGRPRLAFPSERVAPSTTACIGPDDELGDSIELTRIPAEAFRALRDAVLNRHIAPADPSICVRVTASGRTIGAFGVSDARVSTAFCETLPRPLMYLMSDFALPSRRIPRLSKIVVAAALSHESRMLLEQARNRAVASLATTAFSEKPASMKYRGVMRLLSRRPGDPDRGESPWVLNYGSLAGRWSLADVIDRWGRAS